MLTGYWAVFSAAAALGASAYLLEHLLHHLELLYQTVDVLDLHAAACGYAAAAPGVEQLGIGALPGGHRADYRHRAVDGALVYLGVVNDL